MPDGTASALHLASNSGERTGCSVSPARPEPSRVVIKVEGQIVAEWVSVLEDECRDLAAGPPVVLDLASVSYLDARAVKLIRALAARPVSIINCSPLVEELLVEEMP
jgi:anti-anti-sigma regulatory factor